MFSSSLRITGLFIALLFTLTIAAVILRGYIAEALAGVELLFSFSIVPLSLVSLVVLSAMKRR